MKAHKESFRFRDLLLFGAALIAALILCICVGSVDLPLGETLRVLWGAIIGKPAEDALSSSIILSSRVPRVLCVAFSGAALSVCGGTMQGLLKNPLADGTTLGVSSGASLGAALAIAFGINFASLPFAGTVVMASVFALVSLLIILGLSSRLDNSLSTNTIILIGVIFSMFASSGISVVITFSPERIQNITFWTMGSLNGASYQNAILLGSVLVICAIILRCHARELNAFAVGEENARNIGVNVKRTKLMVLITVSVLIGVCVSVGGTIGFVGLVTPHMLRMLVGPNQKRLIPACLFRGAIFLLLADLAARVIFRPQELPIGVVTSIIGAVVFVVIFCNARKGR